ncbi:MAG: hypothetical protein JSS00_07010 [Proteobacteria bacterium]|nr:hypothetical protein [Pseudomonadota bacterium]
MLRLMRLIAGTLLAAALAACASTPPTSSEPAPAAASAPSPAAAPTTSRGAQLLSLAGRANAPARADIERMFGAADIARQDGAGLALTYRLNTCALLLIFTADAHNTMRLAEAHPTARRSGLPAPTLDQCAAEAEARRA